MTSQQKICGRCSSETAENTLKLEEEKKQNKKREKKRKRKKRQEQRKKEEKKKMIDRQNSDGYYVYEDDDHDEDEIDLRWKQVKSFQDMLDLNIEFFEGKYNETPFRHVRVDSEIDICVPDLIEIHKLGLFICKNWPGTIQTDFLGYQNTYLDTENKSRIYFFAGRKIARELSKKLSKRKDLTCVIYDLKHNHRDDQNLDKDFWKNLDKEKSYGNFVRDENAWLCRHRYHEQKNETLGSQWQITVAANAGFNNTVYWYGPGFESVTRVLVEQVYFIIYTNIPSSINLIDELLKMMRKDNIKMKEEKKDNIKMKEEKKDNIKIQEEKKDNIKIQEEKKDNQEAYIDPRWAKVETFQDMLDLSIEFFEGKTSAPPFYCDEDGPEFNTILIKLHRLGIFIWRNSPGYVQKNVFNKIEGLEGECIYGMYADEECKPTISFFTDEECKSTISFFTDHKTADVLLKKLSERKYLLYAVHDLRSDHLKLYRNFNRNIQGKKYYSNIENYNKDCNSYNECCNKYDYYNKYAWRSRCRAYKRKEDATNAPWIVQVPIFQDIEEEDYGINPSLDFKSASKILMEQVRFKIFMNEPSDVNLIDELAKMMA
jgi:hypothetical protein